MRKSRSIALGLVQAVSAAALASGCGSNRQTWQTCVDRTNTVVDDRHCEDEQRQNAARPGYAPYYHYFTAAEIDRLEAATNELQRICLEAGQHIIDHKRFADLAIPPNVVPLVEKAWNDEPPAICGRFDRTDLEDAVVEQGSSGDSVGTVPRPSQSAAGIPGLAT